MTFFLPDDEEYCHVVARALQTLDGTTDSATTAATPELGARNPGGSHAADRHGIGNCDHHQHERQRSCRPLALQITNLSSNATLVNSNGTNNVNPYVNFVSAGGQLATGQSITLTLFFTDPTFKAITYDTQVWQGY